MYMSVNDAAEKFKISRRRVQTLCEQGRITGATMVSGVWLIPEDAPKPVDKRKSKNRIKLFNEFDRNVLTVDDVCKRLSISKATAKNWIRLRKIIPDVGDGLFSKEYIDRFIIELGFDSNTKLKSRRNKKKATGKFIYKAYVNTLYNQKLVEELLEMDIIKDDKDLLAVLANFAIQLYFQSRGIQYSKNNILEEFISNELKDDYSLLIKDLLGNNIFDSEIIDKLKPALEKEILFVKGEDSLGLVYISLRDLGQRKISGAYYTPETVVNKLIDKLYENESYIETKTICDPCCGTGNFLLNLITRGVNYSNLYGQDIDPISVYLARINLAILSPTISVSDLRNRIIICNTYYSNFKEKFDIILGNPPWGSDFSEEDVAKCKEIFKTAIGKSIESYDVFVEKGLTMLKKDGYLAYVLPEAILNVNSHQKVRELIIETTAIRFVSYLGNVFSGVQCPSIILGIQKGYHGEIKGCKIEYNNDCFIIKKDRDIVPTSLSLNIKDEEQDCLNAIDSIQEHRYLANNAKFALGLVTGNNKEYVTNKKQSDNEIILKGSDIQKYRIIPSGNYIHFAPKAFQQVAPVEMYRAKEKLLYRFISETPVFAYDDKQILSLNSCNIVIPEISGLETKYVLAILNSRVTAFYTAKKFNSVKLLRSHIEQIPIPFVSIEKQKKIIKKVDQMMSSNEDIIDLYEELDLEIMNLFSLSEKQRDIIYSALAGKNLFLSK